MKTDYTEQDCIRDTKEHIAQVREFMIMFAQELLHRALVHDKSKMESPELEVFTEYTPKLKDSTYGSDEYKEFLKGMKVGLDHHYANNSHHPEYYKKFVCKDCDMVRRGDEKPCIECYNSGYSAFEVDPDIQQMSLADIVEMICDWKAATMRHSNGDMTKSIEINKTRFGYGDDLENIFKNSLDMFEKGM